MTRATPITPELTVVDGVPTTTSQSAYAMC
ncbi:MAG: hypothetical protein RLZ81_1209 [Pseudomonadota bacterium]|jgi:hypothetical protein